MGQPFDIRYDRRVSPTFLALFLDGGPLSRIRVIAREAALPLDLQMRKNPKTGAEWATLYAGLTSVLDVHATKGGVKFRAHATWSENKTYGFSPDWQLVMPLAAVQEAWPDIELYLERVIPKAVRGHGMTEGLVQSVTSKKTTDEWAILDREVTPSFRDTTYKKSVLENCMQPLVEVAANAAKSLGKFPAGPSKFGAECDLLALDKRGRLLAVEVKPLGAGTIAWVPAQASMYARVLQAWIDTDTPAAQEGDRPSEVIAGTLAQRQDLGHAEGFAGVCADPLVVTPVVVLQKGSRPDRRDQMLTVRELLAKNVPENPAVEIYEVSILGDFDRLA